MARKINYCTVASCDKQVKGRGYCQKHYDAVRRGTDPTKMRKMYSSPEEALRERVIPSGECLLWTGSKNSRGYGKLAIRRDGEKPRFVYVHRFSWEVHHGPIPNGVHIDHLCHNRSCVNPKHLRLSDNITNHQNLKGARSDSRSGIRGAIWSEQKQKYLAVVYHNKKRLYLGTFATSEEAGRVAASKREELFSVPGGS